MKRDTFIPSLNTLLIFGMAVFLSCAHQNRVRDGIEDEAANSEDQAVVSEEGSVAPIEGEAPQGELAELSPEAKPEGEVAAPTEQPVASEDADLKDLGIDPNQPPAEVAATTENPEALAVGDGTAGALTTDPNAATAQAPTESSLDPLTNLESGAGAVAATTTTESTTETTATTTEPSLAANNVEITRMEPIVDSGAGSRGAGATGGSSWSGTSSVPKIPSKAVTKHGTELNRFYVARVGDTPDSVSNLVYGSAEHSADLAKWNGSTWAPGKVLYYKSATEPGDTTMRSFYQERGVQPEEYTIQKGDWLSKVAKRQLGHPKSWKEIAIVNGMNSPDSIEVGQKIAIYPQDLSGYSKPEAPKQEPEPIAKAPEQIQPQQVQPQQPQNQPMDPNAELAKQLPPEPPPVQPPVKMNSPQQEIDPSKLIEQNLPAVFILGGVLVLSALYLMVRRKKSRKSLDDFGDENFAPPTKLKRK